MLFDAPKGTNIQPHNQPQLLLQRFTSYFVTEKSKPMVIPRVLTSSFPNNNK
ncbi:hypothetical protein SAMN06265348_11429 [Pedobacter westerhofensis]|uniref:Uncharacterized protein n=1 Tax=Pedobacter westerhofensis TaxID=425512 RepID=A0A521FM79_9SPHI|nr:hypothetical protein SAMN06265348_11429 [Pedobacter westerhofensis]